MKPQLANVFYKGRSMKTVPAESHIPVILFALPPLHAEMRMSSSMILSFILLLPLCTTKTSFSLILVIILTLVSPFRPISPARSYQPQQIRSSAYIGELGELNAGGRHAQVHAYLVGELWHGATSENEGFAHF